MVYSLVENSHDIFLFLLYKYFVYDKGTLFQFWAVLILKRQSFRDIASLKVHVLKLQIMA